MPIRVSLPAEAAPIVRPDRVTVTAVLAAMTVLIEITIELCGNVAVKKPQLPVEEPVPLKTAVGVVTFEKKSEGNASVMVLPAARAPPAVVVNENVAAADALPATRSDAAIANEVLVT